MTALPIENQVTGQDLAGYFMEAKLGVALMAAGRKASVGLRVHWEFLGDLESRWEIDLTGPFARIQPATEAREAYDLGVVWALSERRLAAHVAGRYGFMDAHRDGTLKVIGSRPNRLRFSRAFKAMAEADVNGFLSEPERFCADQVEDFLSSKKRPSRTRARGVSLRGGVKSNNPMNRVGR